MFLGCAIAQNNSKIYPLYFCDTLEVSRRISEIKIFPDQTKCHFPSMSVQVLPGATRERFAKLFMGHMLLSEITISLCSSRRICFASRKSSFAVIQESTERLKRLIKNQKN